MAEAQISGVLKQLVSLADRELQLESRLILSGDREVRKLESKLRTIQAVLGDAERYQFNDKAVKLWLENLKDTSYELDDVLDEWNTEMIRSEIEKEEVEQAEIPHRDLKKVCSIFFSSCCFRRVDRLKIRHDIAYKIKFLNGELDKIATEGKSFQFVMTKGTKAIQSPKTNSFVQVSEIVGLDKLMDDLKNMLLRNSRQEESSPHVISLVGMGGIGKTTLAQLAYNQPEVEGHFDIRMWVGVSESFDQCQIAKEIIKCVENQSPNATELQILLSRICDLIGGKRFFIVLDDVWNEDSRLWEPFRLAFKGGAQGSTILVTTRNGRVAEMMGSASRIRLELISKEECWMLFRKIAFFEKDPEQIMQFEKLGRELVTKCKGLPLAVKILGGLMRLKNSRAEWKEVLDSSLWEFEDFERGLLTPLLLSYIELPSAMKQCFSYCAVFPKDTLLKRDELVRLWMAQGYLVSSANAMEIIGEEYFENLAVRFFFNDWEADVADGRIIHCKMHGIVHDFAQFLMEKECFTILVEHDQQLGTEFLCKRTRHLSLSFEDGAQFPTSVYCANNLRSLLTLGTRGPNNVLRDLFQHFPYLRALNLSHTSIQELPHEVEKLIHLRYLNLSHNYVMKSLPETICNLCNLQYLDVTMCCCLEKLPCGMGELISLRHLILKNTDLITSLPKGIGRLTSLRILDSFIVGGYDDKEVCRLGELKNLNQLKGDLTIRGLENVVDVFEVKRAMLRRKIHLRHLCLEFRWEDEGDRRIEIDEKVLNALEPNPLMESLRICGFQGIRMYPNWMMSLVGLRTLVLLRFSKIELFPPLGKLPFLESLEICYADNVRRVGVEFLAIESENRTNNRLALFPNLKSLVFMEMREWEKWDGIGQLIEEEEYDDIIMPHVIMPRLQNLQIEYCPKLEALPDFLRVTPLQELRLIGNPILSARCQKGTGEDWFKISHIPKILLVCESDH